MTDYLILALTVILMAVSQLTRKLYDTKYHKSGVFLFNGLAALVACFFFFASGGFIFNFTPKILPYALAFALSYGSTNIFSYLSIRTGPLSLTSLMTSYSLVIPTVYALIFLKDSATPFFYIGLAFLIVSLFLIGYKKESGGVKISFKWIIFVSLAFFGNGMCSTIQTAQQKAFSGQYKSELMIIALAIVAVTLIVISAFVEPTVFVSTAKTAPTFVLVNGVVSGFVNLFVMMLAASNDISASVVFPTISAGGIIATAFVSVLFFKEKLSKKQISALSLGVVAVALMNL